MAPIISLILILLLLSRLLCSPLLHRVLPFCSVVCEAPKSARHPCVTSLCLSSAPIMHVSGMVGPVFVCTRAQCKAGIPRPENLSISCLLPPTLLAFRRLTDLEHNSTHPYPFPARLPAGLGTRLSRPRKDILEHFGFAGQSQQSFATQQQSWQRDSVVG